MPTYQYACTNPEGKHEFEVVQSFSDAPVSECPECGAAVRKVYGSVGVVFKGSGFYRTDSRKSAEKAASNGSSSSSSSKEGTSTSAKDSSTGASTPAPAASPSSGSGSSGSSSSSGSSGSGSKAAN